MNKIKVKQIEEISTSDVVLSNELKVTDAVGAIKNDTQDSQGHTIASDGYYAIPKGTTMNNFLTEVFSKDKYPTKTDPSITITTNAIEVEIGTIRSIPITSKSNPGSYTYGPATGVVFNKDAKYELLGGIAKIENEDVDKVITFPDIHCIGNIDGYVTASHTQGAIPKTRLGNPYPSERIQAASKSVQKRLVNIYRGVFIGTLEELVRDVSDLDSAKIRTLNINKPVAGRTEYTNTVSGTGTLIIAIDNTSPLNVTGVKLTNQSDADVEVPKLSGTVNVAGANNYSPTAYKVWAYSSEALTKGTKYGIIIGR